MIVRFGRRLVDHVLPQTKTNIISSIKGLRSVYTMEQQPDYSEWSTHELISRVASLEQQLQAQKLRCDADPEYYSRL
jgi:hypothetical protein